MLLTIISIVVLIGLDQLTKYWATIALAPDKAAPFLPGIMELRYTRNEGAAFSMLADKEWGRWFLIGVTSIALAVVLYLILTKTLSTSKLCQAALALIFAGGVGNLVDRVRTGYVVDFFATTFIDFAVFNVADCFITVGFALLILYFLLSEWKARDKKKQPVETEGQDNQDGR